ncbi:fluoride efflux transporter CrcB [Spiribacter insolitus]|uniref:Fluoride-specific ion channel FluC n=1 Tax=Spiribacter insolitus TaxID=3122417 RepID=A0ABV3T6B5_9GAMM
MALFGEWAAVAAGGALGALMRHGATMAAAQWLPRGFPWGTLIVNVLGSLLMGIAFVLLVERGLLAPAWRAFFTVGLLGAFTTFSAFSLDALALFGTGATARAVLYVLTSVITCLAAALAGIMLTRNF